MTENVDMQLIEKREALVESIREKIADAGGPVAVAKHLGFTRHNLYYYLNKINTDTKSLEMLIKIADAVTTLVVEKKKEAVSNIDDAVKKLQSV